MCSLHSRTYLAVDEAGPRPRMWTSTPGESQEMAFVLAGMGVGGGSETYWNGSGCRPCKAGRPTLRSTYAGEGSLLRHGETGPEKTRDIHHTTWVTSRFG